MNEVYAIVTFVGTCLSLAIAFFGWRTRTKPGATPLVVLSLGVAIWNVTVFLATITESFVWSDIWMRFHFIGLTVVIPAMLAFALEYIGRDDLLTRRTVALLAVEPVLVQILVWTNHAHGLFVTHVPMSESELNAVSALGFTGVTATDPGIAFWLHAAYSWAIAIITIAIVVRWAIKRDALYRTQLGLVAVAATIPLGANIADNLLTLPVRISEPAFVVMSLVLLFAIVRFGLTDVTPVAHSTVFNEMGSSVLVLDRDDTVVDLNRQARRLFGVDRDVYGTQASRMLDHLPDVSQRFADLYEGSERIVIELNGDVRHFHVEVTPLSDSRDRFLGRAFLIHDVTDEIERREELERQNEHLETFASVLSHDLRNPLEVARGHTQLARDADDVEDHLDHVTQSHERIEAIIDDVLTLAREGKQRPDTEQVNLAAVVDDAWRNVSTDAATLENEASGVLNADRPRLIRALENLFRNAIEHGTSTDGDETDPVSIRVGVIEPPSDGGIVDLDQKGFFVEDDGPGILVADRDRIFETGFTNSEDGTGLGLSIVHSIIKAHGWKITATDASGEMKDDNRRTDEPSGARFEVTGVGSLREQE